MEDKMPRSTHPRPRAKHPRAVTRDQRARKIEGRWKKAKDRFWSWPEEHPETIRHEGPKRPYNGGWPFYQYASRFADNTAIGRVCSCELCCGNPAGRRTREKREWRKVEEVAWHGCRARPEQPYPPGEWAPSMT